MPKRRSSFDEKAEPSAQRMLDGNGQGKLSGKKYESGTSDTKSTDLVPRLRRLPLTVVLDFGTGKLVAFASNEELTLQHGTLETGSAHASPPKREQGGKSSHPH
jgi:hypothetical protein